MKRKLAPKFLSRMNSRPFSAFTLVEMLTVMAVIAILASLIVSVNAYAHKKAALLRAEGEIKAISTACENYKGDFGAYPQDEAVSGSDSDTVTLCPQLHGNPLDPKYGNASLVLYKALSGDAKQGSSPTPPASKTDKPDGKPETKSYFEFRPSQLRTNALGEIQGIQDPFGNLYGYSTNAASAEATYRQKLQISPNVPRPNTGGFNVTFDLWSTAGVITRDVSKLNDDRKRWIKNW